MGQKLSHKEFTLRAIRSLRKDPYKGIHVIFSGFNKAFKEYFGTNPVEATQKLAEDGVIVIVPSNRGVTIYDARDLPQQKRSAKKKANESSKTKRVLGTILNSE